MSRAEASQTINAVTTAIGMTERELAEKLADYYLENKEAITQHNVGELVRRFKP
jgi:hypothetical protein